MTNDGRLNALLYSLNERSRIKPSVADFARGVSGKHKLILKCIRLPYEKWILECRSSDGDVRTEEVGRNDAIASLGDSWSPWNGLGNFVSDEKLRSLLLSTKNQKDASMLLESITLENGNALIMVLGAKIMTCPFRGAAPAVPRC